MPERNSGLRRTALFRGLLAASVCGALASPALAEPWPRFRGPDGSGVAADAGVPTKWTEKDLAWSTTLPGVGHSSPVVWDNRLFVTSASADAGERRTHCLSTDTGKILWTREVRLGKNAKHAKSSYASASPATDGERVYALFADADHYRALAYDFAGAELWNVDLGPFASQHGQGASPIVHGELLIVPNDQDGESAIVALDRRTGKQVWRTPRPSRETSYATPLLIEPAGGRPQLICVSGVTGISSLDPATGEQLWASEPLPQRTVASPVYAHGLVIGVCGQGARGTKLYGVSPVDGATEPVPFRFKHERQLPYVPTSLAYDNLLFLWGDGGVVTCLEMPDGKVLWTERVGGNYSASPVCINGYLYNVDETGEVVVVRAAPKFELVGKSPLGEGSYATPAVADGAAYFRTFQKVVCLKMAKKGRS